MLLGQLAAFHKEDGHPDKAQPLLQRSVNHTCARHLGLVGCLNQILEPTPSITLKDSTEKLQDKHTIILLM